MENDQEPELTSEERLQIGFRAFMSRPSIYGNKNHFPDAPDLEASSRPSLTGPRPFRLSPIK